MLPLDDSDFMEALRTLGTRREMDTTMGTWRGRHIGRMDDDSSRHGRIDT